MYKTEEEFLKHYDSSIYEKLSMTADILILSVSSENTGNYRKLTEKKFSVLLTKRTDFPFKDKWCLPGGFIGMDEDLETAAKRILGKLQVVNSESFQWFELLLAFVFAIIGYMSPIWLLMFQAKMRQLEMEDEVMQFQTIILMLMRIERINVEMMLEWLERYSNIFKSQITRCVNDYESGAWEALENLKNDISYLPLIRIVESMQAAVEKIPIKDAFDELDSEREYYRDKRKESNERLIKRQGMIGKVIGFAPMICLFVGYLIIPLVFIGLTSMSSTFSSMSSSSF